MAKEMNKSLKVNFNKPFLFLCFLLSAVFFAGEGGKDFSNSVISFVGPFILFLFSKQHRSNVKIPGRMARWAVLSAFTVILSFLIVGGGIGSVLSNLNLVLLIITFYSCTFTEKDLRFYVKNVRLFTLYLLLFVFYSRFSEGHFGGINANSIGMQAFVCFCFLSIAPHKNKFIQLSFLVVSVGVVLLSSSRTSLGALLLFCLIAILLKNERRIQTVKHITSSSFIMVLVLAVAITYIYSVLFSEWAIFGSLMEYSADTFDKSIMTGREVIWLDAWEKFFKGPHYIIWGIGSHFYGADNYGLGSNFHSSFFTVFICCGLLGYIALMRLFYFLLIEGINEVKMCRLRNYLLPFSILFLGFFESVLFSGNFAIQLLLFIKFCHIIDERRTLFFA